MKRDLTPEERREACRKIKAEGYTFWELAAAYPHCRAHDLRRVWGLASGASITQWVPSEVEMRHLKEQVQAQWGPEDWSKRWVGRFASGKEEDLQSAASRLAPH